MSKVRKDIYGCATNFLRGRKCVWCGSFRVNKTARGYVKCRVCTRQKSLKKIRVEIAIVTSFYQQQPACRLATDLAADYQSITVAERAIVDEILAVIRKKTREGSVYCSDTFKSYKSLKRLGKHHTANHSKSMADKKKKIISPVSRVSGVLPSIFSTTIGGFRILLSRVS